MGRKNKLSMMCNVTFSYKATYTHRHIHTYICYMGQITKWDRIFRKWIFSD